MEDVSCYVSREAVEYKELRIGYGEDVVHVLNEWGRKGWWVMAQRASQNCSNVTYLLARRLSP